MNLKVNPDRTTAIAMEKKTGSRKAAKGFFLVQGIAVVRSGLGEGRQIFLSFRPSRKTNIFLFNGEANTAQAFAKPNVSGRLIRVLLG